MLKDVALREEYRSDRDDLAREFYVPCLTQSVRYDRAVGYFTSAALGLVTRGLVPFLENSGRMRLIASPHLDPEDVKAIREGYERREALAEQRLLEAVETLPRAQRELLAWMVAKDLLDVRVALPKDVDGGGLFHEKLGLFYDASEEFVAFTGSANETLNGLSVNFEQVDVFPSWEAGVRSRALRKQEHFESLWADRTPFLDVVKFPEAVRLRLLESCPARLPKGDDARLLSREATAGYSVRVLREYQKDAIREWFKAGGHGLLEMATGSGKTFTALSLLGKLHEQVTRLAVVIVCPYVHLVEQWAEEMRQLGFTPLLCYEARASWTPAAMEAVQALLSGARPLICFLTTCATFGGTAFQSLLDQLPTDTLLIGDEVHNLGSKTSLAGLPGRVRYRLGLSATPERWYDEAGTMGLKAYFGDVVYQFTLRDALTAGCLTPYYYHPVLVELTDEEEMEYHHLSAQIARIAARMNADEPGSYLKMLLLKRARLVGAASGKLPQLRELLGERPFTSHTLFYCGDGTTEEETTGDTVRQVEMVLGLLGDLGYRAHQFTAAENRQERAHLLHQFEAQTLQALVAIRCLDEGVDVPATHRAYILASTTNPRQSIQRLGRVLRRAPGKESAEVYDFLVVPAQDPLGLSDEVFNIERNLLRRELQRASQFASLARNGPRAMNTLLDFQQRYHLLTE